MAGLVNDEMTGKLSVEEVRANIKVPPELQEAYDRVVIAGMKIMFSKATNQQAMKAIEGEGSLDKRLGVGIAGLLAELFRRSNNTIPPQVLIPAGTDLLMQAADFLRKTRKETVTDKVIGDAMAIMVRTVLETFGVDPEKMVAVMGNYSRDAGQQQAQQMGA